VFNAYGPHQPLPAAHAPVIPRFLRQALTGGSLVVHGDGRHTRDYVYIDDVVDALAAAATAHTVDRHVINVGSGQEVSTRALVDGIRQVTGARVDVLYTAEDAGVSRMCADLTLAAEKLGFRPKIGLLDGLRLTLERDPRFAAILLQKS